MPRQKKLPPPPPYAPHSESVNDQVAATTTRYDDVYYLHEMGRITAVKKDKHSSGHLIQGEGEIQLRLSWVSDQIVKLKYSLDEPTVTYSYALAEGGQSRIKVEATEDKRSWHWQSKAIKLSIAKKDGCITIRDAASNKRIFSQSSPFQARTTLLKGLDQLRLPFDAQKSEAFYGLGDKTGDTDLRGRTYQNWCTDSFGYGNHSDELYRAIPFFYGLRKEGAYGIFLDNSHRTHFDFDSQRDGQINLWADGGDFDVYFIYGPQLDEVAARYIQLTGTPELPPLWALGYHQCRWSYYPESRVRELASDFREKNFPCDAIYLDIDYMDGYRCFTWNEDYFPNPKQLISDLRKSKFETVVMIDPGIRVDDDYEVYSTGMKQDAFCRRKDGRPMVGPVWPPACVWPDYTKPTARDWWGKLYKKLYKQQGVSGFWNDMNEPAVFKVNHMTFPGDVQHDFEGQGADHNAMHNVYGMQMSRATYDGLKHLKPKKRPFLLCRATFSGGQRYAALWTGDNIASWEHLVLANRQCLRLSISGFSFVGTDIGGFVDDPTGELMVRWLQLGVFHPLMRVHSMGNNTDGAAEAEADAVKQAEMQHRQNQEPWVYGEPYTSQARAAVELRYKLLPYLYTSFRAHLLTGIPVLRNLFFYDQKDPLCRKYGDQFLVGRDMLVCPVLKQGQKSMQIYLPKGKSWYDYWTGKKYAGGKKYRIKLSADRILIFMCGGSVLPQVDTPCQATVDTLAAKQLSLTVYVDQSGAGQLYWDKGEGYDYEQEGYLVADYAFSYKKGQLTLTQSRSGQHKPSFKTIYLQIVGREGESTAASIDGKSLKPVDNDFYVLPFDFETFVVG
ncbi:MAG: TIM-barrel domain-containing protein [Bacteroidota bacterium]